MALGPLSDESKILILTEKLANPPYDNMQMGLSELNVTPDHATTLAALVADEFAYVGYARQVVTGWITPVLTPDFHSYSEADPVDFTKAAGSDSPMAYTWFWVDVANTKLVRCGRFTVPFVIPAGATITFIPFEQLTGE